MSPTERQELLAILTSMELNLAGAESAAVKRMLVRMILNLENEQEEQDRQMAEQLEAWGHAGRELLRDSFQRSLQSGAPRAWLM